MLRFFGRFFLVFTLLTLLSGCFHIQLLGSIVGSQIRIYRLDGSGEEILLGPSIDEDFWIAAQGGEQWYSNLAFVRLLLIGIIFPPTDLQLAPDEYYIVETSGGEETDPNFNHLLTDPRVPVLGNGHAILTGKQILEGNNKVSLVTEIQYQYVQPKTLSDISKSLGDILDETAQKLVSDVDANGVVDQNDVRRWNSLLDTDKYLGDEESLQLMADAITQGLGDEAKREIAIGVIEAPDVTTGEPLVVCAGVVHAPPADAPGFLSRLEIDVDAGPKMRDLSITIGGANLDMPVVVDVSISTAVLGISDYGEYKFGTVLLGGVDVSAAFSGLPPMQVDDNEHTFWCKDIRVPTN
jgi:hypothetical protein